MKRSVITFMDHETSNEVTIVIEYDESGEIPFVASVHKGPYAMELEENMVSQVFATTALQMALQMGAWVHVKLEHFS